MSKILVIEDQPDYQIMICTLLEKSHYLVVAGSGQEAMKQVQERNFDLILLDVNLPDGNGFEIFTRLRAIPKLDDVPVIFLTGLSEVSARVEGLSLGADDYIVKPFEPMEFAARVESKLRVRQSRFEKQNVLRKGRFQIDMFQMKAFVIGSAGGGTSAGSDVLDLTPTEFKLLHFFLSHENEVISREQLTQHLWSDKVHVSDRTVDRHVSGLRLKLNSQTEKLESVRATGYKFSCLGVDG